VRAGALSSPDAAGARPEGRPPSWFQLATTWALFAAAVVAVAVAVHLAAPGWLGDSGVRELPDRPLLMVDIFFNNLLLALVPLFGGWLAAGHLTAGRRLVAGVFLLLPAVIVARSLVTVGAVGGGDPSWLSDSARWWLLEVGALAVSARTGLWLARHPQLRDARGPAAMRRALAVIVCALAAGATVEVLTA
jgi:hypothetical protein